MSNAAAMSLLVSPWPTNLHTARSRSVRPSSLSWDTTTDGAASSGNHHTVLIGHHDQLFPAAQTQHRHGALDVIRDGLLCDVHPFGDLGDGQSRGQQLDHLALARVSCATRSGGDPWTRPTRRRRPVRLGCRQRGDRVAVGIQVSNGHGGDASWPQYPENRCASRSYRYAGRCAGQEVDLIAFFDQHRGVPTAAPAITGPRPRQHRRGTRLHARQPLGRLAKRGELRTRFDRAEYRPRRHPLGDGRQHQFECDR